MHANVQWRHNPATGEEAPYYRLKESYRDVCGTVHSLVVLNIGFEPALVPRQMRRIAAALTSRFAHRHQKDAFGGPLEGLDPAERDYAERYWRQMITDGQIDRFDNCGPRMVEQFVPRCCQHLRHDILIYITQIGTQLVVKNGEFSFGQNTFVRHFGGWRGTLEAFIRYVDSDDNEVSTPSHKREQQTKDETSVIQNKQSDSVYKQEEKVVDNPKNRKTNRDINLRLRFKVMARGNFKCCICGKSPATDPSVVLHIDHIKPWAKGGTCVLHMFDRDVGIEYYNR